MEHHDEHEVEVRNLGGELMAPSGGSSGARENQIDFAIAKTLPGAAFNSHRHGGWATGTRSRHQLGKERLGNGLTSVRYAEHKRPLLSVHQRISSTVT
jgi:hypothetical protein